MKQLSLTKEAHSFLSTSEWYQQEKENYALSSQERPEVENTLNYCFRQTTFPSLLSECASKTK